METIRPEFKKYIQLKVIQADTCLNVPTESIILTPEEEALVPILIQFFSDKEVKVIKNINAFLSQLSDENNLINSIMHQGYDEVTIRSRDSKYMASAWIPGSTTVKDGFGQTIQEALRNCYDEKINKPRYEPDKPKGYEGDGVQKRHKINW